MIIFLLATSSGIYRQVMQNVNRRGKDLLLLYWAWNVLKGFKCTLKFDQTTKFLKIIQHNTKKCSNFFGGIYDMYVKCELIYVVTRPAGTSGRKKLLNFLVMILVITILVFGNDLNDLFLLSIWYFYLSYIYFFFL